MSAIFVRLLSAIAVLLVLLPKPSHSAVLSVDLGSEWAKVAVVNLKPGQSPISIAINEMSKRKSPALVAFQGGDRLIGEEAAGLVARYPDKVYSLVRDLIGKPYNYVKEKLLERMYLPFDIVEDSRGVAGIRIDGGVTVYSAEELTAMVLGYALRLAEFHAKVPIKDTVITVPPYFGQAERKGLLQAAQLAGMNVLSLINEHSGAAIQYGIDKNFSNGSRHVIFYDMGATSTYAALACFSAYNAKEYGKTVSINQFQVKDVRWDPQLGGQDMELRLVEYFADEFNSQLGNGFNVRNSPKAMAKLKKQVKRTGNTNANSNSNPTSHSSSQRFSNNLKSKAAMIGLPKTQKTSYVDTTKRRNCKPPNIRLFPKRPESVGKSVSMAEPSSPKVSCMGRVRSKRGRRKSSEPAACAAKAEIQARTGRRVRRVGIIGRFVAIFRSDRSSKPVAKTDEPVPVESLPRKSLAVRNLDSPRSVEPEPPGLGGMTRFASGRRSTVSWETEDLEQRLEDNVSKFHSSDPESGPGGKR